MDIQDLLYFLTVYDTGSYSKAAEKLFLSRQALRQKLQRLEAEIGNPLFVSGAKKVEPTDLGRYLYPEAQSLVTQFGALELNLLAHSQQRKTELTIAMGQGVLSVIPYDILLDFQQLHPQIILRFSHASDSDIVADVQAGKLDLGIIGAYNDLLTELDAIRIQTSPHMHLHVSLDNPLSQRDELEMSDLQGQTFISSDVQSHSYQFLMKECQALGFQPDFQFHNLDNSATHSIASRRKGITWSYPPSRPEHSHPKFKTLPLRFSDPSWGTYIISQPGRKTTVPARMLIQYLCDHVQDV